MSWNSHHGQKQSGTSYITQEFVAHGANVSDLVFGQKSGRVMATGGEDKKVNLWVTCPNSTASKPNCILVSYHHHQDFDFFLSVREKKRERASMSSEIT